jgi:CRP/FNR family transcriptional regulator
MFMRSPEAPQRGIVDRSGLSDPESGAFPRSEARTLSSIVKSQRQVCYSPKAIIFHEGDTSDSIYQLASGLVCLYRFLPNGRRLILRFIDGQDFVGLSFDDECPFTAECVESTTVYKIARSRVRTLCAHSPALQNEVTLLLKSELMSERNDILPMMHLLAEGRVARLLLMLARRGGAICHAGDRIQISMTRGDIADFVGLTTETVCRSFAKLKRAGLISTISSDKVMIKDLPGLISVADGD